MCDLISIIALIISFISIFISAHLKYHYSKKEKEYQNLLDKNNYITKTQFDYEFKMYQEISLAAFNCIAGVQHLSYEMANKPFYVENEDEKYNRHKKLFEEALSSRNNLSMQIHKSRGFMDENIFESYLEFDTLCDAQIMEYELVYLSHKKPETEEITREFLNNNDKITAKYEDTAKKLREYLKSLKVISGEINI